MTGLLTAWQRAEPLDAVVLALGAVALLFILADVRLTRRAR